MAHQAQPPRDISRRTVVTAGSSLLAGFGLAAVLPAQPSSAAEPGAGGASSPSAGELALYRPVEVSSTDYAPTPGEFVVDKIASTGVRGTGWRAADGDPQWISVDLQAECQVSAIRLTFEGDEHDPVFVRPSGNWSDGTTGKEILSSYSVDFVVETSRDKRVWTSVYRTTAGTGGVVDISLDEPVAARWVRMTSRKRSNPNPLGLNGFEVYGVAKGHREPATGWTDWGRHDHKAPALEIAADGTAPVESGWTLTMDDWAAGEGAALSGPEVDTSAWLPATVPGTVLASLVDQGHLPDPVSGLNNLHVPEALSRHSWWYRREFEVPRGLQTGPGRHVWLEFDGINHQAEIWLNGRQAGAMTYPFARSALDITGLLAARDTNALAVKITPMPIPGSPGDKGPAGESWVDAGAGQMNLNSPTYLAASGWDWMPAVRDRAAGIWNHVRLRSTGAVVIGDPRVDTVLPQLPDTSVAELTITVPVRNADSADSRATVSAAFGDVNVSQAVVIPAGKSIDVVFTPDAYSRLRLRNPRLWWPNGLGDADLHDLILTASVAGQRSDRRTTRFGIRQFGYSYKLPLPFTGSGDSYTQTVDVEARTARYVRIRCLTRATGWGSSLWSLSVLDSSKPTVDLALHAAATASSSADGTQPGSATDGDPATRWTSAYEDDQWLQVDLGSAVAFDRVDLTWEQAYAQTYTVQVSADGSAWTDAKSVDNSAVPLPFNGGDSSLQSEDLTPQTARFVRLNCGLRQTSWGTSLWSLAVVNSSEPGTDLALHKKATASSEDPPIPSPTPPTVRRGLVGRRSTQTTSGSRSTSALRRPSTGCRSSGNRRTPRRTSYRCPATGRPGRMSSP